MCWSYDATLGFCVFETVILAYIWKRNVVNDRINVIGHIPILVQEMLQLWMWTEMNPSEDTQLTCSDQNRWVSFLIAVVVHTAPMFMLLRGYLGALQAKSTEQLLRVLKRALKVISGVCVTATIVTGVMMWAGTWVSCTVKGPFGHQIWAMLMVPDPTLSFQEWLYPGWIEALPTYLPFPFLRVALWFVYMSLAGLAWDANQRIDLGWNTLGLAGPPMCVLLGLLRGYEWGSMWCHLASLVVIMYVISPWFEGWRKRVTGKPGNGCITRELIALTAPSINNGGWEHLKGWRENPQITMSNGGFGVGLLSDITLLPDAIKVGMGKKSGVGGIPFGPDYESKELWKPIWPKASMLPVKSATPADFQRMFAAWELANAEKATRSESAADAVRHLIVPDGRAVDSGAPTDHQPVVAQP